MQIGFEALIGLRAELKNEPAEQLQAIDAGPEVSENWLQTVHEEAEPP